jgi:hypothetical protein
MVPSSYPTRGADARLLLETKPLLAANYRELSVKLTFLHGSIL